MDLEQYVARLNGLAFFKEFTFARNKFKPQPGNELELADNIVWLGNFLSVFQLKERKNGTDDPSAERTWFTKRVLGKATSQIRDTMRFLDEHEHISITNERGHEFDIGRAELTDITKVVVYLAASALPFDCRQQHFHLSRTVGFIHILAAEDYLGILDTLRTPEDIRRYFEYRKEVTPKLRETNAVVSEPAILGAFLGCEQIPSPQSRQNIGRLVQDLNEFDLSQLIGSLQDHLEHTAQPYDYYAIMLEFARVPRSVWREVKLRFVKTIETIEKKSWTKPYRLSFLATDCTFMICPLDSQIGASGAEGMKTRIVGLKNFTYAAKYEAQTSKAVGLLISKNEKYFQIEWCFMEFPWVHDAEIEMRLATSSPFRPVKEAVLDSFRFINDT